MGLPPDTFAEALEDADDDDEYVVHHDCWITVMVFLALQTQWRRELGGMSGVLGWHGLDYVAAESVIRLMGYRRQASDIFAGLRIMESAALSLLNAKQ